MLPEDKKSLEKEPGERPRRGPRFTRDRTRSDVADSPEMEEAQKKAVRENVEHLHGPGEIDYAKDELVVLCLLRDAHHYIESFVDHYFSLGAKHLVFLDNGSTDGTVEALKNHQDVTVLRTGLPFKEYQVSMKQYLVERFGKGRWSLTADADELFDYPYSDVVGLEALLGYLNEHRYTAVVAHMLDMFPEEPISREGLVPEEERLKELYRFYDLSNTSLYDYRLADDTGNVVSNDEIGIVRGGIRKTLFDNNATLIKHPLIFLDDRVKPLDLSEHWVGNARIADFSGVLLHYKFSNRLYGDVARSVESRNRSKHGTQRYGKYLRVLKENPTLHIRQDTAQELESVNDLVDDGFVVVSRSYMSLVKREDDGGDLPERFSEDALEASLKLQSEARHRKRVIDWSGNGYEAGRLRDSMTRNPFLSNRDRNRHDVPDTPRLEKVQKWLLHHGLEHLHGPGEIDYAKDELVVLCLLRDAHHYIESFVDHYFSLGAKHLVFLDNGSTDGTVEALKNHQDVTVLRTGLPFKEYQVSMKQYLVERFGKGRWSLTADADELFDYPYSDVVGLEALLGYLNEHRYTAVVAHMLDMFPEEPISEDSWNEDAPLKETHKFYDLSNVNTYGYGAGEYTGNVVSNEEIEVLQGGIQKTLFDIRPPLTKHPLIFLDDRVKPLDLSEHWVGNARIADFSGVLFHYKLLGSLYKLVRLETEEGRYVNRHGKYEKYRKVLEGSPSLRIGLETSREIESVNDLVGTPFAAVSKRYMGFVEKESLKDPGRAAETGLGMMAGPFFRAKAEAAAQRRRTEQLGQLLRESLGGPLPAAVVLEERTRSLKKQRDAQAEKVRELNQRMRDLGPRARDSIGLENKTKDLERQIRALQSSRSWRLITALASIKAKLLGKKP